MRGGTGVNGHSTSVRDRQRSAELAKIPAKTATQLAADHWEQYERNWKDRIARDEQEKLAAQRKRQAKEKADAELQQRRATFQWKESLIDAVWSQYGLSQGEIGRANSLLGEDVHNAEKAVIASLQILAERNI